MNSTTTTEWSMPKEGKTPAAKAVRAMEGKVIELPDLTKMFGHWTTAVLNRHYTELVEFVNQQIDNMLGDTKRVAKHKKDEYARFIAMWFPTVDWEKLKTLTYYTIWLFLWDDSVDTAEYDLADNFAAAEKYRRDTMALFNQLFEDAEQGSTVSEDAVDGINRALFPFARGFVPAVGPEHRREFLRRVDEFIKSCSEEQVWRMEGFLPDKKGPYLSQRLGTSAVYTLCGLLEFIHPGQAPEEGRWKQGLWYYTNLGVILVNDVLSLRKELKTGCVVNLVSILLNEHNGNLDGAVREVVAELKATVEGLDICSRMLDLDTREDPEKNFQVRRSCDSCRNMIVATYYYSITSNRYRIQECVMPDGSINIQL